MSTPDSKFPSEAAHCSTMRWGETLSGRRTDEDRGQVPTSGIRKRKNPMSYDDLSLSIRLSVGENAHSIQMMNPGLFPGRAHI